MRLELEKYKGTGTRHTCPACGSRNCFARYKDENGEYINEAVGRCNRESKCGYHKKPKDYFVENPHLSNSGNAGIKKKARSYYGFTNVNNMQQRDVVTVAPRQPDYIEQSYLLRTLGNYEQNSFVQFLLDLFPEDADTVWSAVKDYLIGTSRDGKTIFWQIDQKRKIRTGKLIAYNSDGKRRKDISPNWIHSELKKSGHLKNDFNLRQCFFGEHLLSVKSDKPAAIAEAEKTAVIASICFPKFIWLAAGAKQNLNAEKLQRLGNRRIILYPDADGFNFWQETAQKSRLTGLVVKVSSLIETHGTDAQKADGYDLADYLVTQQKEINEFNLFADDYNARLEVVMNDENLNNRFNLILDEQIAVMTDTDGISEVEAEKLLSDPVKIRQIVMSL